MLIVQSTRTDNRVVLFERHEDHPNGEAFVSSQAPIEVGDTPLVRLKIALRQLALVETPVAEAPKPSTKTSSK